MLPDKGSKWYFAGRHYEIVAHGEKDGEPAVYVRDVNTRKKVKVAILWRLQEKRALRCS